MKRILLFIVLFGLIALSCDKDKDENDIPAVGNMTMTKDGNQWKSTSTNGTALTFNNSQIVTAIGVYLKDSSGQDFETTTITMYSSVGSTISTGDYVVQNQVPSFEIIFNPEPSTSVQWVSKSGNLTVTKISDNNVQGTFSGVLARQGHADIQITNGSFNVNLMSMQ